jgi:hypothetical protein
MVSQNAFDRIRDALGGKPGEVISPADDDRLLVVGPGRRIPAGKC